MDKRLIILVILVGTLMASAAVAAPPENNAEPIEITSKSMVSEQGGRLIVFTGQVIARQGDATLYCDEMHIFQNPKTDEIDKIEAYRQVRVVQGQRVATGDRGTFFQKDRKVVLTGNARAVSGKDQVAGERITFYLDQESSQVEASEGGRVRAIFFPKSEKK